MTRLRLVLHALDRTGPPMLALAFARWLASARPDVALDVVAFRGGPLASDFAALGRVEVLLYDHEAWDHDAPDPGRVEDLRRALAALDRPDRSLLVSIAGGQCLPYMAADHPVVTWSVEQGEDLHWLDDGLGLAERTDRWLAGTAEVRSELSARLGGKIAIDVVPEFVDVASAATVTSSLRQACGLGRDHLLVVGAGIATFRKAPDLFLEVAAAYLRSAARPAHFAWIGGEDDPMFEPVRAEVARLGLEAEVTMHPSSPDLIAWLGEADILLHPARLDAFPLVCLHAAASATPVVAFSGVGGVEEMFEDAFLGAPYPDVAGLAACLAPLADADRRHQVGTAQQARVADRFLAPMAAPRLLAAVEALA